MGAAPSHYISQCLDDTVPEDADLVLAEFSFNDFQADQVEEGHKFNSDARYGDLSVCPSMRLRSGTDADAAGLGPSKLHLVGEGGQSSWLAASKGSIYFRLASRRQAPSRSLGTAHVCPGTSVPAALLDMPSGRRSACTVEALRCSCGNCWTTNGNQPSLLCTGEFPQTTSASINRFCHPRHALVSFLKLLLPFGSLVPLPA
jgi:hypothetical protein